MAGRSVRAGNLEDVQRYLADPDLMLALTGGGRDELVATLSPMDGSPFLPGLPRGTIFFPLQRSPTATDDPIGLRRVTST
jgi:hypothetical protein